jgi:hypothetical protein
MGYFVLSILTSSGNADPRSLPAVSKTGEDHLQSSKEVSVIDLVETVQAILHIPEKAAK